MFNKDLTIAHGENDSSIHATISLITMIGIAAVGTIFAFLALNPLLEFVTCSRILQRILIIRCTDKEPSPLSCASMLNRAL